MPVSVNSHLSVVHVSFCQRVFVSCTLSPESAKSNRSSTQMATTVVLFFSKVDLEQIYAWISSTQLFLPTLPHFSVKFCVQFVSPAAPACDFCSPRRAAFLERGLRMMANTSTRPSMTCTNHSNRQNARRQSAEIRHMITIWTIGGRTTTSEYATAASASSLFLKIRESMEKMPPRRSTAMKVSDIPMTAPCL